MSRLEVAINKRPPCQNKEKYNVFKEQISDNAQALEVINPDM